MNSHCHCIPTEQTTDREFNPNQEKLVYFGRTIRKTEYFRARS